MRGFAQFVLFVLIIAAVIGCFLGVQEVMLVATESKSTVWQQISARIYLGLSLVLMAVSTTGLAVVSLIGRSDLDSALMNQLRDMTHHVRRLGTGDDKKVRDAGDGTAPNNPALNKDPNWYGA